MRNLSDSWKLQIVAGKDIIYLKYVTIELVDGTVLNLDNSALYNNGFKFETTLSDDDSFDIGSAVINTLSLTIINFDDKYTDYVFEGAKVTCYIGISIDHEFDYLANENKAIFVDENGKEFVASTEMSTSRIEKMRICTMEVVDAPYQNSVLINLTCEDYMRKFDKDYSNSKLTYPATRLNIVKDACNKCGVTLQTTSFSNSDYIVNQRPNDENLTFRQVLSWVAMLGCQNAHCDEYGRLCIDWYNTEPDEEDYINISSTSGLTVNLEDVVITGVRVTEYSEDNADNDGNEAGPGTYLEGDEGYVIEIADNKLITVGTGSKVASMIGKNVIGMQFRPFSTNCLTDIALETGDSVKITDFKGNTYTSYITKSILQPGEYESVSNNAKSATRNSSKQYSQMTQLAVATRKNFEKERTAREKALEDLSERLETSSGLYTTRVLQSDGSYIYYLHNKKQFENSDIIWKMTAEAWAVSTNGGETWNAGVTVDGDVITRILTATGINADWIDTGAITVKDKSGNIIFLADMDTNTVKISGENVIIGGAPLEDALGNATNLVITLSNTQSLVSCGSNGGYTSLSNAYTYPTVMYGSADVTKLAKYTTSSNGLSGTFSTSTYQYKATSITNDINYVDITATYNSQSVTARYYVNKTYDIVYSIEPTNEVIHQTISSTGAYSYTPKSVTFKAYRQNKGIKSSYSGRIRIDYTADGDTWTQLGISANVSSKTNTIGAKEVSAIRARLFVPGSDETNILAEYVIKISEDVAITQEKTFNALTNNGAWKGIYKSGSQMYINFDYAHGGTLKLGGSNNGNGVLEIYNASGTKIGKWDKDGISATKGTFSGTLSGADGTFSGELKAATGTFNGSINIGGSKINGTLIVKNSSDKTILKITRDMSVFTNSKGTFPLFVIMGEYALFINAYSDTGKGFEGVLIGDSGDDKASIKFVTGSIYLSDTNPSILINRVYTTIKSVPSSMSLAHRYLTIDSHINVGHKATSTNDTDSSIFYGAHIYNPIKFVQLSIVSDAPNVYCWHGSGGGIYVSSSSSKRYKDIERDMNEGDVAELYKIQPVIAKYKDDYLTDADERYQKTMPMFIAEDVDEHFKICASHNNDGTVEDWNYRIMIPAMFQMIKSQKEQIDKMEEQINSLTEIINTMKGEN